MTELEQARRDLKRDHPKLYAYITKFETAKVLDSAGDTISGMNDCHMAANRLWARSSAAKDAAEAMTRMSPKVVKK